VRNTAVSNWDPNQYLLQAKRSLAKESYDLAVLILYLGNDIIKTRRDSYPPRIPYEVHLFRIPRSLTRRELINAIFYPINDFLEVHSHLFIFLKRKARIPLMQLGLTAESFPSYFFKSKATTVRWDVTAQICKEIVTLAKEHGIGTVIVLLPTRYQVDRRKFNEHLRGFNLDPDAIDLDQPNQLMGSALQAHNLEFIDVMPDLQHASSRGLRLYGDLDDHFTANGHAVLMQAIEPVLVSRLRERFAQRP